MFLVNTNIALAILAFQMMWDDSVEIGCGQTSGEVGTFIVCHYSPPGNIRNEFTRHVHPPIMGIDIKTRLRALGQYVQDKSTYDYYLFKESNQYHILLINLCKIS